MAILNHFKEVATDALGISKDSQITFDESGASRVKKNRDAFLPSVETLDELNTYLGFTPFHTISDMYEKQIDRSTGGELTPDSTPLRSPLGVRSIFNAFTAVPLANADDVETPSDWRLRNNVPLLDSRSTRDEMRYKSRCTIKDLVNASRAGYLGRETYSYSDFMYCKHLGKLPNNYLITLRRFPIPVSDYISRPGLSKSNLGDKDLNNGNAPSIGAMVTWMGTPGNDMANILKYSYSMPFKFQTSKWEDIQNQDAGADVKNGKLLPNLAAMFDPVYQKHAIAGEAPLPFGKYLGIFGSADNPYTVRELARMRDSNKVYGPVDAIKSVAMRSDEGLKFEQSISLTFEYELRAYGGINARQAMLDLIANILTVTYNPGDFWCGGYLPGGVQQHNLFTNLRSFKVKGGFNEWRDAFNQDLSDVGKAASETSGIDVFNLKSGISGVKSLIKSVWNNLSGMLLGGMLNKLGRPQKTWANALMSPAPVGFWHVTIGNPWHPIMTMGNMILKNTTVEHYGPLGLDDFPTGLKITCELERGKPRDSRAIENLYLQGNDRIYSPMSSKILDMYKHAKSYKKEITNNYNSTTTINAINNPNIYDNDAQDLSTLLQPNSKIVQATPKNVRVLKSNMNNTEGPDKTIPTDYQNLLVTSWTLQKKQNMLKHIYGDDDQFGILMASKEMEFGASQKEAAKSDKTNGHK